ncbi:MAG: class I SAM-dependent methyltransferase [Anaerolineae bacterium]
MSVNDTRRTYDRIAARYAARDVYPMTQELTAFLAHVPQGGRIVDVGCGSGVYARMMITRGYRVLALDLSGGMLVQARAQGLRVLVHADMRRLPLAAASVEGCFLSASLLHLPRSEAPRALHEVRRVLRRDGVAYISVKAGDGDAWVSTPEGGVRYFVYYRPAALDRLLQTAGFTILRGWVSPPGVGQNHPWINRVVQGVGR